jgi:hypothetical protein
LGLRDRPAQNADGSPHLYLGPTAPAGKDANWLATVPGKGYFAILRFYDPRRLPLTRAGSLATSRGCSKRRAAVEIPARARVIEERNSILAATAHATEPAVAQQVPIPATAGDVTAGTTGIVMHPTCAKAVAQVAYISGWPMVNMLNRGAAITQAPQPGRLDGVLPVAPRGLVGMLADYIDPGQTFVPRPNQDVVYGLGFFSLDEEPVVVQVPDFGGRF